MTPSTLDTVILGVIVTVITLRVAVDIWIRRRESALRSGLRYKWIRARYNRRMWERLNYYSPNLFYDEEYQKLWDIELGAGDLYEQMANPSNPPKSRIDYGEKEEQAHRR